MAAPYRGGAGSRVAIGRTSAADINAAPASPITHVIPHTSQSIPALDELMMDDTLTEYVDPVAGDKGLQVFDGYQIQGQMGVDHIGLLARFAFGGYSVSGASAPYVHTNKATHTALPLAAILEYWDSRMNSFSGLGDQFFGAYVKQIQLAVTKQSNLVNWRWTFGGTGFRALDETSELDSTPTEYTRRKLAQPGIIVKLDDSATDVVTGVNLTINIEVNPMLPLDGNLYAADMDVGGITYDFKLNGWRDDGDTLFSLDDDSTHKIELIIPEPGDATRYVNLTFDAVKIFSRVDGFNVQGRGPQEATVTVSPQRDGTAETSLSLIVACDIADMATALGDGS
jgi:hypothetical protein